LKLVAEQAKQIANNKQLRLREREREREDDEEASVENDK
jgi:hypothetical protein